MDLLEFFEVEPQRPDPNQAWPDNDFAYCVAVGKHVLSFSIAPAYRDVRVRLTTHDGDLLYELHAQAVAEVRLRRDKGKECLEVQLTERDRLQIAVRPDIRLEHHYDANP